MRWLILALFVLSGASGLIYELLWMRSIGLLVGSSTLAVSAVLAAFMGGLSLGSWAGGRVADRLRRPLLAYGLLELAIAGYCLAFPSLLATCEPLAARLYQAAAGRPALLAGGLLGLGGLLMLLPTALMGATYPLLVRQLVARRDELGRWGGRLYAANTLGAVAGAAGAGFLLLPALGMRGSLWVAVGINLAVGLIACWLGRGRPALGEAERAPETPAGRADWIPLAAFFCSGLVAMLHQVGWTRAASMTIGSTTYAFSLIVALFILGLSAGGALGSVLASRAARPLIGVAWLLALFGLAGSGTTWALGRLPLWVAGLVPAGDAGHLTLLGRTAGLLALVLLPPAICSGMLLPFVLSALDAGPRQFGRHVGRAYGVNTLGTIAGSLLAAFLLIPALGIEGASRAGSLALVAGGALLLLRLRAAPAGAAVALLAVAAWFVPRWDPDLLASGMYLYAPRYRRIAAQRGIGLAQAIRGEGRTVFHRDGPAATVQVKVTPDGEAALLINGKAESSTRGDLRTQQLLAHLPLLFSPRRGRVLVIGLGGGITLASARLYPEIERLDCVELSRAVIEAARGPFARHNRDALAPRTGFRLIEGDGRTHLALSGERYDVISSEPSNPWIAGMANLFTAEFFELVRRRLLPGGVFCQWLHAYRMERDDVALIVRTFRRSFPRCYLFKTQLADNPASGDYLLLGSDRPLRLDWPAWSRRFVRDAALRADLAKSGIGRPAELLDGFLCGPAALERFAGDGPLNTDDNARLEFSAPHALYRSGAGAQLLALLPRIDPAPGLLDGGPRDAARLARDEQARRGLLRGESTQARALLGRAHRMLALRLLAGGDLASAIEQLLQARRPLDGRPLLRQDRGQVALLLGRIYRQMGSLAAALAEFESAVALMPENALGQRDLGLLLQRLGRREAARARLQQAYDLGNRQRQTLEALRALGGRAG